MDEAQLLQKLRKIQALYAGARTPGERAAAGAARDRLRARLEDAAAAAEDAPVETRFSMPDEWSRRLFVAIVGRHGLRAYRYKRQRHTTVMVRAPKRVVDEVLWPEFLAFEETLHGYLNAVTTRVIAEVFQAEATEAAEVSRAPEPRTPPRPAKPAPPPRPEPPPPSPRQDRPEKARRKIGRNDPCPCGSGKKYKRCCRI